ncbi:MAG: LysM peptidoglycan-binding domain-containing protein [Desulfatiglandaceae bacterium]
MNKKWGIPRRIVRGFCPVLPVIFCLSLSQAQEEEKTYSISLTKTAGIEKDIYEVEDKKVLAEEYTVQKGEWVWKVLRERGLLQRYGVAELLSVLKELNTSLGNLNLVHPGDKIIIPLKIVPVTGPRTPAAVETPTQASLTDLKDVNLDDYTVEPGDSLTRVIAGRYDLPKGYLYKEYLDMVKQLNPSITDLNLIYPGQRVRLPIFSPKVVRKPIEPPKPESVTDVKADTEDRGEIQGVNGVGPHLKMIFSEMGEDWVQTGEHFIPLPSGGQIDLKAASFPILNLQDGLKVIVDVNNNLPHQMARLIESSWESYRVVHLLKADNLGSALNKILMVCNYPKLSRNEEALELSGDIPLRITGDWIVTLPENRSPDRPGFVVINLRESPTQAMPAVISAYTEQLGVKIIEYPSGGGRTDAGVESTEMLEGGVDSASRVSAILDLVGQSYTTQVKIPIFQKQEADFKLVVKADYFLRIKDRDAVIDLTGLAPEVISLLEEHQFLTLSLADEKDPLAVASRTLDFIGVESQQGPHSFLAADREDSRNVRLTVTGIVFSDTSGKAVFATPLRLPTEIVSFLSTKDYRVLDLSAS